MPGVVHPRVRWSVMVQHVVPMDLLPHPHLRLQTSRRLHAATDAHLVLGGLRHGLGLLLQKLMVVGVGGLVVGVLHLLL